MSAQKSGPAGTRPPTRRYKVNFVAVGGREEKILVPCDPNSTVASLGDEIARRLFRAGFPVDVARLQLRLDSSTGPLLDHDDSVGSVLFDPATETIFALDTGADSTASQLKPPGGTSEPGPWNTAGSSIEQEDMNSGNVPIKVRILTPALARANQDARDVPVLPATFSPQTTLGQLYERTSQHLGLPRVMHSKSASESRVHRECNCSLARAVQEETLFRTRPEASATNRVLVIHSRNVVEPIECASNEEAAVTEGVRARYGARPGFDLGTKTLRFFAPQPSRPAIVTICSAKRHQRYEPANEVSTRPHTTLDLHTTESPIRTRNFDLTLEELGLVDLANDGVLTIFAVCRSSSGTPKPLQGQDAIYLDGPHWELPVKQTERGMAMFLSSLRMAVHLISRGQKANQTEALHDSALHMLHVLTRFPPAVRAMHILLEGSVPMEEECSALIQACHGVVVDMIATSVIRGKPKRTLEGSRLFFSAVLSKAREFALKRDETAMFPYISALKSVNLTNSETMEPIAFPVDTFLGLMEQGCFDALKSGIIEFTEDDLNNSLDEIALDGRTKRAASLCDGALLTNTMFDMDVLYSSSRYRDGFDEAQVIDPGDLANILQWHAVAGFRVAAPAALGTSESPVLTLDRDGSLAVYLGRKSCGTPGQDYVIFRPTQGGDCDVDISIIAQLLEPIIATRVADGTAIFDGEFHAVQRRSDKPDEILMICVDCSGSMKESAGFVDTEDEEDADDGGESEEDALLDDIRQNEEFVGSLNDQKEALQAHESFDDMVQAVRSCSHAVQLSASAALIKRVADFAVLALMHKMERLETIERRVWRDYSGERRQLQDEIKGLRSHIAGILTHQSALSEFLIYRGCWSAEPRQPWKWTTGSAIPNIQSGAGQDDLASAALDLTVPYELRCPMTQDLFQEPMTTQDGHTYEAAAIRKWFRIAQTSPLTGLGLSSTQLSVNRTMSLRVNKWVEGTELMPETPTSRSSTRRRTLSAVRINFLSPLAQFTRIVPLSTPNSALYELAFRGLRGQYPGFTLDHSGTPIGPDDTPLSALRPKDGFGITIQLPDSLASQTGGSNTSSSGSGLCLVKVYRDRKRPDFSFWVRKDTKASMASVLFKTWRHIAESPGFGGSLDEEMVWYSLMDSGDGHMTGQCTNHWDKLSGLLHARYANGKLQKEPLCAEDGVEDDSSSDSDENSPPNQPSQDPLVLKLYVCGRSSKKEPDFKSRLSVLKQMFDQFVNRILAYGYSTHLGLIQFDSTPKLAQKLSPVIENFRSTIQKLEHGGDTALWDALALARDQIQEYSAAYPDAKKRILCISDGMDTKSKVHTASELWKLLSADDIVVDSFCLGSDDNDDLRTVSYLTHGYKFHPRSLEQAMAICEMEPVLSQLERDVEDISASRRPPQVGRRRFTLDRFAQARREATAEIVTQDVFPKRIEHPGLRDNFFELKAISRQRFAETRKGASGPAATSASYIRTYRIMTEMQRIVADPHPHVDVYVSERDMCFWKVIMQGPPDSVYTSGTFVLYLHMEDAFPGIAPKARFVTPIYHPNVNRHGRICHSILDRNWTSDTSINMVISTIYGLLMQPDYSDPVNIVVTLDFHHDQVAFADMARDFIRKHASKTREEWRAEMLSGQDVVMT
ncbi:hypothetical protein B0T16DRAFT_387747 [Cercophora newfieldiana]|uniref:peptidylprolyl isomerase n=1 Tax=Cercophora newfieldiana TaxID=92897 RepID=A0AA39YHN2_9PEZI|nr:hypothetical protein B0T16DRAFT_387747 [Cercophora newfieldiana]